MPPTPIDSLPASPGRRASRLGRRRSARAAPRSRRSARARGERRREEPPRSSPRYCAVSSQPPAAPMPWPKVPLRAVTSTASGSTRAGSRPPGSRPAWRWRAGPRWRSRPVRRRPPASACGWPLQRTLLRRRDDVVGVRADAHRERLHARAAGSRVAVHVLEVADDPDRGAARDVGAAQPGERLRDLAVGRDHARVVEAADQSADAAADRSAPITTALASPRSDGVHRQLEASRRRSSRRRPARRPGR